MYAVADKLDPKNIDYSFYDMPVKVFHHRDDVDIAPYATFADFMD